MRRRIVLTCCAFLLTACGVLGGGLPDHFEGTGAECGRYRVTNDPNSVSQEDIAAQECLIKAFRAGDVAYLSVIIDSVEGHPSRVGFQVTDRGLVTVEDDSNGDPQGPPGVRRFECTELAVGEGGMPEPSGCN